MGGNDIFDTRLDTSDNTLYQVQNISFFAAGPFGNGSHASYKEFANQSFALQIKAALEGLPNGVIDTVGVSVNFAYDVMYEAGGSQMELNIKVTFTGSVVAGPQNLLIPL